MDPEVRLLPALRSSLIRVHGVAVFYGAFDCTCMGNCNYGEKKIYEQDKG